MLDSTKDFSLSHSLWSFVTHVLWSFVTHVLPQTLTTWQVAYDPAAKVGGWAVGGGASASDGHQQVQGDRHDTTRSWQRADLRQPLCILRMWPT